MTLAKLRSTQPITLEPERIKRWSVDEYHRISELGLLDSTKRTELLAGHITFMASKGTPHVTSLYLLANLIRDQLGNTAMVRTQDPIVLDDWSEPEPDLAIVQGSILDYAQQHPQPHQVYLIVEVADSTLKQDCEVKDKLYAQAGITDYWVLDLQHRQLHIFRDPTPEGYTHHLILKEPHQIAPLAFSEMAIALSSILPPTNRTS